MPEISICEEIAVLTTVLFGPLSVARKQGAVKLSLCNSSEYVLSLALRDPSRGRDCWISAFKPTDFLAFEFRVLEILQTVFLAEEALCNDNTATSF